MDPIVIEAAKIGPILAGIAPAVLAAIIGGAASVLSSVIGTSGTKQKQKTATTTQTTTSTPTGYQSPVLGLWDTAIGNLLGQNVIRNAGMGYPAGGGLDTSLAKGVVSLLGGEGKKLLDMYQRGGASPGANQFGFAGKGRAAILPVDPATCKQNCWNTYKNDPAATSADYEACVAKCGGQGV